MANKEEIIQSLQYFVNGLSILAMNHEIHGKVFNSQGFAKLREKYIDHVTEERGWVGKFIDSCIVGVICFIVLSFLGVPYVVFNSTFIGITNMIPIFGPFIGAVPCTLMLLIDTPGKAIEFIVVILIIQQIDGNILGPRLIGGKVGISAYWILFSVVVFGRLFGIFGMFFGVPFFTTVYKLIKRRVIDLYTKKDNLVDDEID